MAYEQAYSKVYFGAGFRSRVSRSHAGSRLCLERSFGWDGIQCRVPAVYLCADGPVMDLLLRIEPERLERFARRWGEELRTEQPMCVDDRICMAFDSPFTTDIVPQLMVNAKSLARVRVDTARYNPHPSCCPPTTPEADGLMELYGCDPACGWLFVRVAFHWATRKKPAIHSMSLTLEREKLLLPGPEFQVQALGQAFDFYHPVTRVEYRLSVLACLPETAGRIRLNCTVTPDLSGEDLIICDCRETYPAKPETPLLYRSGSVLHEAHSLPMEGSGKLPDWRLFFLCRRSGSITILLCDERVL